VPGRLKQVVQLHLSRDCNRPELAALATRHLANGKPHGLEVHTACQDEPGPSLVVGGGEGSRPPRQKRPRAARPAAAAPVCQPWLPGLES